MPSDPRYIIEFIQKGRYMQVNAVDVIRNIEVTMIGDAKATQDTLERLAIQKLQYKIRKMEDGV